MNILKLFLLFLKIDVLVNANNVHLELYVTHLLYTFYNIKME